MNAYKLADEIDITKNEKITRWSLLKASVMLRKQQDEIEALKLKYKQEFDYVEKLLKEQK